MGEAELVSGPLDGPLNKGFDYDHGPNLSLGSKC